MHHRAGGFEESRLADVMPCLLLYGCTHDEGAQVFVGCSLAHLSVQVMFNVRKQAGANFAVGGEPDTAAGAAEGLGDRRDDADLGHASSAGAVGESVAAGGFAGRVGRERAQWVNFDDALDNFAERHDHGWAPEAVLFKRHELDEPDDDVFAAGEMSKALDLIVVETAQEDAVDFDALEAGFLGGADAADDCGIAAWDAGDAFEGRLVDGIHAHGYAAQAGGFQRCGQVFEEMAVGGDGDVQRLAGGGTPACQLLDHYGQIAPQEWFSAGEAHFFNAEGDEVADEAEVIFGGEFGVLCACLSGAAVDAFVIATVGDGDAQVGDDATVAVL